MRPSGNLWFRCNTISHLHQTLKLNLGVITTVQGLWSTPSCFSHSLIGQCYFSPIGIYLHIFLHRAQTNFQKSIWIVESLSLHQCISADNCNFYLITSIARPIVIGCIRWPVDKLAKDQVTNTTNERTLMSCFPRCYVHLTWDPPKEDVVDHQVFILLRLEGTRYIR